jgi:hypothetical protein
MVFKIICKILLPIFHILHESRNILTETAISNLILTIVGQEWGQPYKITSKLLSNNQKLFMKCFYSIRNSKYQPKISFEFILITGCQDAWPHLWCNMHISSIIQHAGQLITFNQNISRDKGRAIRKVMGTCTNISTCTNIFSKFCLCR